MPGSADDCAPGMAKSGLLKTTTESFFGLQGIAGFIASTFAGLFVGTFCFGWLPDRFGRRKVFTISLLWYSIGSAIMGPQVFEKALSCVHNVRFQEGRPAVSGHSLYVVDLQDGGGWDWTRGEPPKDNPAYYLRFCKSFARMGGTMTYVQCDNVAFLHNLLHQLGTNPA